MNLLNPIWERQMESGRPSKIDLPEYKPPYPSQKFHLRHLAVWKFAIRLRDVNNDLRGASHLTTEHSGYGKSGIAWDSLRCKIVDGQIPGSLGHFAVNIHAKSPQIATNVMGLVPHLLTASILVLGRESHF